VNVYAMLDRLPLVAVLACACTSSRPPPAGEPDGGGPCEWANVVALAGDAGSGCASVPAVTPWVWPQDGATMPVRETWECVECAEGAAPTVVDCRAGRVSCWRT
jgi:hypothetical protein